MYRDVPLMPPLTLRARVRANDFATRLPLAAGWLRTWNA